MYYNKYEALITTLIQFTLKNKAVIRVVINETEDNLELHYFGFDGTNVQFRILATNLKDLFFLPISYSNKSKDTGNIEYKYDGDFVTVKNYQTGVKSEMSCESVMKGFKPIANDLKSSLVLRAFLKEQGFDIEVEPKTKTIGK